MPGLGDEFRAARESRGLSLSDAMEQLHIRSVYLQAIEKEDWSAIGASVYVRGFLRTYARFLGLPPEDAVARFNATLESAPESFSVRPGPATLGAPASRLSPLLWASGILAVVLVAFVVYNAYLLSRQPGGVVPVAATSSPSPTPAPQPSASAVAPNSITLRLVGRSYLRLAIDGATVLDGVYPAGTLKTFQGKRAILRVGNAAGVDVSVGGKEQGIVGASGAVVDRTYALAKE